MKLQVLIDKKFEENIKISHCGVFCSNSKLILIRFQFWDTNMMGF